MPFGQVAHVDVVAHAGAVRRRIVAAEHLQVGALAHGHLRDVGHQVVGYAGRVLADQAAGMRADRIEVAQHGDLPRGLRGALGSEHVLDHQLGVAIRVGVAARGVLGDGHMAGSPYTVALLENTSVSQPALSMACIRLTAPPRLLR